MHKTFLLIQWTCWFAIGATSLLWARGLSLRYNAWTTRLRERSSYLSPPPTPEWRARNTAIMTWIFRVFGFFLVALSFLALLGTLATKQ